MDASERLAQVQQLLADLPGPYGNGHLWVLARLVDRDNPFESVLQFLQDCVTADGVGWFDNPSKVPQVVKTADDLARQMRKAEAADAVKVLAAMTSETMAYTVGGRYPVDEALDVFAKLRKLLGHGTDWWSNNTTDGSWYPVTWHTFDALVLAVGGGVVVAVLTVDED